MDKRTESPHLTSTPHHLPPAHLWIGAHDVLLQHVYTFLQKHFCKTSGCNTCVTCTQIASQQYHAITWLYPEKQYTRDQLDAIFNTIAFSLNPGQQHFFVLQKADFLTPTCANSLLKPIEEPPPGYHFLLLAQREEQVLPTIRSRCIVTYYTDESTQSLHPELFDQFTSTRFTDPNVFLKQLDQSKINERESVELLDALLSHWMKQYKKAVRKNETSHQEKAEQALAVLKHAALQPPMPGSSKIFWKNLFLQIKG